MKGGDYMKSHFGNSSIYTNKKTESSFNVYLCKTCGHNVCYPFILHSKGIITDGEHDMVYIGSAQNKEEWESYYFTHLGLFKR